MGNSLGGAPLEGSDVLRSRAVGTGFQDKFHQCDCPEKLCALDFPSGLQMLGDGACIASLAGGNTQNALLFARVFQDKFHQYDCSEKLCTQESRAAKVWKPWAMGHALLRWQGARLTEQSCWHGFFRTNSINAIVPKNWCQRLGCLSAGQRDMLDMHGKQFFAGCSFCSAFCPSMLVERIGRMSHDVSGQGGIGQIRGIAGMKKAITLEILDKYIVRENLNGVEVIEKYIRENLMVMMVQRVSFPVAMSSASMTRLTRRRKRNCQGSPSNSYPPVFRARQGENYRDWKRAVRFWLHGEGHQMPVALIGPRVMVRLEIVQLNKW